MTPELPALSNILPTLPGRQPRRRRSVPQANLTEEERRSILGRALGGLAHVGGAIDKPFAATRGTVAALGDVLQGKSRKAKEDIKQLLHLIPFSGTFREQFNELGVPVPEEHIWGREVLERFGAPKNKPTGMAGWRQDPEEAFWDVAGTGADLLITPPLLPGILPVTAKGSKAANLGSEALKQIDDLTRLGRTEEALSAAGKFYKPAMTLKPGEEGLKQLKDLPARLLGTTPAAKVAEIAEGERALVGLRPAWGIWSALLGDKPVATLGKGSRAAKALDALYYKSGLIPAIRSGFGATTKGVRGGAAQRALEQETAVHIHRLGALRGLLPFVGAEHDDLARIYTEKLGQYAKVAGDTVGETEFRDFARYISEVQSSVKGAARMTEKEISALFRTPANNMELLQEVNEFSRRLHSMTTHSMADVRDTIYEKVLEYGAHGDVLRAAFVAHTPRRRVGAMTGDKGGGIGGLLSRFDYTLRRVPSFDVPEGTWLMNQLAGEGLWSQTADKALAKLIDATGAKTVAGFSRNDVVRLATTQGVDDIFEGAGRIAAFDGSTAIVSRIHPHGYMDQVRVPVAALEGVAQASGSVPPRLFTRAQQRFHHEAILLDKGVSFTAKESDAVIRAKALFHGRLKPAFDREFGVRGAKLPETWAEGLPKWLDEADDQATNLARVLERLESGVAPLVKDVGGKMQQVAEGAGSVSDELAAWLHGGPALPAGLFNRTLAEDHATYLTHALDYLHGTFAKHNFLRGVATLEQKPGYIPLEEAWASVTTRFGRQAKTQQALTERGLKKFASDFAPGGEPIFVPPGTSKALQRFQDMLEPGSKARTVFGQAYDLWTAAVKAGWTLWAPAFHVRNFSAGQFQNLAADGPYTLSQYGRNLRDVWRWIHSQGKQPWRYAHEVGPAGLLKQTLVSEMSGAPEDLGIAGGGLRWIFGAPKTWNPIRTRGVPEALGLKPIAHGERQFVPMAIGERAYSYVESMNRLPLYGACRDAGMTMEQAVQFVKRVQYDYSAKAFAPFERDVMRRFVFPFYSWLKNNANYHVGEIFGNPGGKVSTAIRMAATSSRFGTGLPRWLSEQGAVPLGGPPEATTVVRQFGFPFEDIRNIQGSLGRTAKRFVSQMHPGITTAAKLLTGEHLYTGQNLNQMANWTGIWQIDTLLQGLPTSRAVSTLRTATDRRKSAAVIAADLLTGVKLGTYDLEKARLTDLQQAIQEEMELNPYVWEGRHQYVPKHLREAAGPDPQTKLRQIRALSKERDVLEAKRKLQQLLELQV